jgi:hypothetical protein
MLDLSLRDYLIDRGLTPRAADGCIEVLQRLNWPEASLRDPLSSNRGAIFFHDTVGLIARTIYTQEHIQHPFIAPRIRSFPIAKGMNLSIYLGLSFYPAVSSDERTRAVSKLTEDNIFTCDNKEANWGRIPLTSPEFPHGLPVLLDPDYVDFYDRFRPRLRRDYPDFGASNQEGVLFRNQLNQLRRALLRAIPPHQQDSRPELVQQFWKLAQSMTCNDAFGQATLVQPLIQGWANPQHYDHLGKSRNAQAIWKKHNRLHAS